MGIYVQNGRWVVDFTVPGGKRIRSSFSSERAARAELDRLESGRWTSLLQFESFANKIIDIEESIVPPKTVASHVNSLARLLETIPADICLNQITPDLIQEHVDKRKVVVKNSTINRELAFLSKVFSIAISNGEQLTNPLKVWKGRFKRIGGRKPLPESSGRTRYLTIKEARRLLEATEDPLTGIIEVALYTGMRQSEIFGMKWEDVDFNSKSISLFRKWKDDWTQIPMSRAAERAIARQAKSSDYVFPVNGLNRKSCRTSFERAVKLAKLDDVTFHVLRHTFASHAMMQGMDLTILQFILGHQSLSMTMRYAHLSPGRIKKKMTEIGDYLATEIEGPALSRHTRKKDALP